MRKCRPSKWVPWAVVGVGLPLLCAALITDKSLKSDVVDRAKQTLAGSDLTKWAEIELNGRIATVKGKTTNAAAPDEVVKLVAGTYGVRKVVNATTVEPLSLVAPTIESLNATAPVAEIKGTWPEEAAQKLTVTVGETAYTLPGSAELTTSSGNWLLKLPAPLAEGSYDVMASASADSDGATVTQAAPSPARVVVDLPDPVPPPAIAAAPAGAAWPYAITGSFPEADVSRFAATVDGHEYVLGAGPDLTSDGKGTFSFAPSQAFAPGSYDVTFSQTDKSGNATSVTAEKAIIVPAAAAVPEAAPAPAVDTAAPAAAAITLADAAATDVRTLTGTWPEGDATRLAATLEGRTYVLDTDSQLTRTGNQAGTFTFTPDTAGLAPGAYPVEIATSDAVGNTAKVVAEKAIVIPAAAPAPAPEPAPAPAPEPAPAPAPAPVLLAPPTVDKQLDLTGAPILRGTWPESEGTSLTIGLAGKTYELGANANLSRDGAGKWKLFPSAALKDGIYDVVVTARNGDAQSTDQTLAEIEVDATLPDAPTVTVHASDAAPGTLAGTYDAKRSTALKVAVPQLNLTADLGAEGSALTADGEGAWTLALPKSIAPGTYDVVVTATDKRGRSVEDTGAGEIVISAANEPAPKTDAQFDCAAVMTRINTVFPMRFIFARTDFQERFGLSVNQYAALLKDSRCSKLNVEVGGHADERGSDSYNEDLAERRAARVRDMLLEAGVAKERLSVSSYGESQPLNAGHDEEAWSTNRRVEIKILK